MTTKRKASAEPRLMAYVSVGYQGFLVPLADGQRLVSVLASAVTATERYRDGPGLVYEVDQAEIRPEVSLKIVQPGQVVAVRDESERQANGARRIGHELLKLKGPT